MLFLFCQQKKAGVVKTSAFLKGDAFRQQQQFFL